MSRQQTSNESDRKRVNKQARDLGHLLTPVLRAIPQGGVLTPAEVCASLPNVPPKDVRKTLLTLHDDGVLHRVTMPDAVLYARANPD